MTKEQRQELKENLEKALVGLSKSYSMKLDKGEELTEAEQRVLVSMLKDNKVNLDNPNALQDDNELRDYPLGMTEAEWNKQIIDSGENSNYSADLENYLESKEDINSDF